MKLDYLNRCVNENGGVLLSKSERQKNLSREVDNKDEHLREEVEVKDFSLLQGFEPLL